MIEKLATRESSDNIVLVSGAGDGDTGGGLCAFDGESVSLVDRVSSAGMAVSQGRLLRLLRTPFLSAGGEFLVYDERGVVNYVRADGLSDAHGAAWDGENAVVVASTGNNSLVWLNLAGGEMRRLRAPGEDDSWHINDVCLAGGRLYGCAFGRYRQYRGYKSRLMAGDGMVFDVESGENVVSGLCAPHTPRFFDGAWTVCDSARSALVQIDGATGRAGRSVGLRAFPRGLGLTRDYVIVGESAQRGAEVVGTGSLAVLRREDLSLAGRFSVPFAEVSDVVVAPAELLEGVRRGFRTNPLRTSEDDQLQLFRQAGVEPRRLWAVCGPLEAGAFRVRLSAEVQGPFECGRLKVLPCRVENRSEAFLCSSPPNPVHLSYRWRRVDGSAQAREREGLRTVLPRVLAAGESVACRMEVLAPEAAGRYQLTITLVQEQVAWFDDVDAGNAWRAEVQVERPLEVGERH